MGKVIVAEAFTRKYPNVAPFALLEITDTFFGPALQFENLFGNFVKHFTGIGQRQFFADVVDKLNVVKLL